MEYDILSIYGWNECHCDCSPIYQNYGYGWRHFYKTDSQYLFRIVVGCDSIIYSIPDKKTLGLSEYENVSIKIFNLPIDYKSTDCITHSKLINPEQAWCMTKKYSSFGRIVGYFNPNYGYWLRVPINQFDFNINGNILCCDNCGGKVYASEDKFCYACRVGL